MKVTILNVMYQHLALYIQHDTQIFTPHSITVQFNIVWQSYLKPGLQVAIHCSPFSPGKQFSAPWAGACNSQSTHGVACTATCKMMTSLFTYIHTYTFHRLKILSDKMMHNKS